MPKTGLLDPTRPLVNLGVVLSQRYGVALHPACALLFNSLWAFDKHRTGTFGLDRRCMTEEEMRAKGMTVNADGFWITAEMPLEARPLPKWNPEDYPEVERFTVEYEDAP